MDFINYIYISMKYHFFLGSMLISQIIIFLHCENGPPLCDSLYPMCTHLYPHGPYWVNDEIFIATPTLQIK
jgi:hypothetical protein